MVADALLLVRPPPTILVPSLPPAAESTPGMVGRVVPMSAIRMSTERSTAVHLNTTIRHLADCSLVLRPSRTRRAFYVLFPAVLVDTCPRRRSRPSHTGRSPEGAGTFQPGRDYAHISSCSVMLSRPPALKRNRANHGVLFPCPLLGSRGTRGIGTLD
ncbi:hypothetical protein DAEQUDRAFT_732150 [Daedalea quercina L-15889]|uniref:Uncharacterized protein n=1 Tax=Daedalea quercina L-15889 TaxID=1314783 RepID=A0A165LUB5_9APHY|nr:hypothetical protein DAEQUDRAFT_732150 [Daedalea quercina L-15889]